MERVITKWGAMAVTVGSMLGVGIFLTPPLVARAVGSAPAFLLVWLVGGLVAMAGATVYGELGAMFPRAGGDYVYIREAFGDHVSFASGIILFVGIFGGSIAAMAVALCQYQLHGLLSATLDIHWMTAELGPIHGAQLAGAGVVVALTGLNVLGAKSSTRFQLIATVVPIGLVLTGVVLALLADGETTEVRAVTASTRGLATASAGVYFAYAGWNGAAYVAGEIEEPGKNLPMALLGGTGIITLTYGLACAGFVALLGLQGVRDSFEVGSTAARSLGGPGAELIVAVLILVALLGSVNATVLGGARIVRAMAGSGNMPSCLGGRAYVPTRGLWLQCGVAAVLIFSGTFESLIEMTSITMVLLSGLATIALFRLRVRLPVTDRPYRACGYPVVPGLFLSFCIAMIAVALWEVVAPVDTEIPLRIRLLPLVGVVAFGGMLLGRWVIGRHSTKREHDNAEYVFAQQGTSVAMAVLPNTEHVCPSYQSHEFARHTTPIDLHQMSYDGRYDEWASRPCSHTTTQF